MNKRLTERQTRGNGGDKMKRMKNAGQALALLLAVGATAGRADDLAIQSFDATGRLAFNEIAGAMAYRVEWAPAPGGPWTNTWDALAAIPPTGTGAVACAVPMCYRVAAVMSAPPPDMALIPAGSFQMGDALGDGIDWELPAHTVQVSAVYMDKYEVSWAKWQAVRDWAVTNGYAFEDMAFGKAESHPVHSVTWYDCLKWCNARSEMEGRTPAYYKDYSKTVVYRSGMDLDLPVDWVRWDAGYRLPTEAEWEKAARGGAVGRRFPWADTDTIDFYQANYSCGGEPYDYDISEYVGYNPVWDDGNYPMTSPVGAFAPNGYGLHDMAGNVMEWCWDRFGDTYYSVSPADNPRGPASGSHRVARGGSWDYFADLCRAAYRGII